MVMVRFGVNMFFVPVGVSVGAKGYVTQQLKRDATIKKNLDDIFDGELCSLSRDAMIILTTFGLHNYGGSDEALEMCITGSWVALF